MDGDWGSGGYWFCISLGYLLVRPHVIPLLHYKPSKTRLSLLGLLFSFSVRIECTTSAIRNILYSYQQSRSISVCVGTEG